MSDETLPTDADFQEDEDGISISDEEFARDIIAAWGKPIPGPKEWDQQELKFFNAVEHRPEIEVLARGLTMQETLNYYGLVSDVLPEYDALYFVSTFLRGRVKAKSDAVNHLFTSMSAIKGGSQSVHAATLYLKQFADSFKGMDEAVGNGPVKAVKIELVE